MQHHTNNARNTVFVSFIVCFCLSVSAFGQSEPPKISGEIRAHQAEKRSLSALPPAAQSKALRARGLNPAAVESEDCALYMDQPLTQAERNILANKGIHVSDTYVPAVPGKHPHGFYLATVNCDSLPLLEADSRFVRGDSTAFYAQPPHDPAGA